MDILVLKMPESIWTTTLDAFYSDLASVKPVPAAGSAAAVSARLAVSVLIKVLEIAKRKRTTPGDSAQLDVMLQAARNESQILSQAADEDGAAFAEYLESVRKKADRNALDAAMLTAIQVPMTAAKSSVRALQLCREASSLIPAFLAADLGAAVLLLSGAVRAVLTTVDYNLSQLSNGRELLAAERRQLEDSAARESGAILLEIHNICS